MVTGNVQHCEGSSKSWHLTKQGPSSLIAAVNEELTSHTIAWAIVTSSIQLFREPKTPTHDAPLDLFAFCVLKSMLKDITVRLNI